MDVEVELLRIIINENSEQQLIILKERNGNRSFPIVIGIVEVLAIDRRLKGIKPPRPMTHDLLDSVIKKLGAKIEKIVINDLKKHTFHAKIMLNMDGRSIEIDCRPSDAIALTVVAKAPIYVDEDVLRQVCQ